jgi:membrane associated rhomboid family serine protease
MLIPYSTDAPIYHWPFATVGTIVVNALIFLLVVAMPEEQQEWVLQHFALVYGQWNPIQWLTSNYLHADLMHVLFNMLILWGIGIIVEGKIGWWRFLALYNGIGIVQCGVEQTLLVMAEDGGSLGASAIIYGLIAIAMVWAPKNELDCVLLLGFRVTTFELPVLTYAAISIGIQVVLAMLTVMMSSAMGTLVVVTSQVLHLIGAAVGFAVGVFMLNRKWVDCENWDLFSVLKGRNMMSREELAKEALRSNEGQAKVASVQQQMRAKLHEYLAAGEAKAALALHRRGRQQFREAWKLSEDDHIQLIGALRKAGEWEEAVQTMVEYLKTPQSRAPVVRLALAQVLIERLGRPRQALKVLSRLDPQILPEPQRATLSRLNQRAQQAAEEDPFEVVADDW